MHSVTLLLAALLAHPDSGRAIEPIQLTTEHYELDLRVDYEHETLSGTARLTLRNVGDQPVATVPLLLYRLLEATAVRDGNDRQLAFDQDVVRFDDFDQLQVNAIRVRLPAALAAGQRTTIALDYSGRLLGYSETGMLYVQDRIDPAFTIIRDDARAFPTLGVPSATLNRSAPSESYDYLARITVPDSLFVANGGRLVERRPGPGGSTTFVYQSLKPSWRMDFAISHYRVLDAPGLRVWYLAEDSAGAAAVARMADTCMRLFTGWFGPLRDTPVLTFLEIPDGWGSQKDVTTIIQTAAAFRDSTRYHEVYHELAHLWQPEITDHPSPRWNEGLASFLEMLALERLGGTPVVDRRANQLMDWLRRSVPQHPRWQQVAMVDYGKENLTDLSYSVGAILFDLLYRLAGPEAFNRALGAYYQGFAERGGSTAQLEAALAANTRVDLRPVFRDWLHTTEWYAALQQVTTVEQLAARYR